MDTSHVRLQDRLQPEPLPTVPAQPGSQLAVDQVLVPLELSDLFLADIARVDLAPARGLRFPARLAREC